MKNILYWVDLEGFGPVGDDFLVKELAVLNNETKITDMYYFKVGDFYKLPESQRKQALYVKQNIHGLKFIDGLIDLEQPKVFEIIRSLCREAEEKNKVIAYKGTLHTNYIFKKLNYLHIAFNIETEFCPKYQTIILKYPEIYKKYKMRKCSRHFRLSNGIIGRCAMTKNYIYMEYFKSQNSSLS